MLCAQTENGETVCLPPYTREQITQMRDQSMYYCPSCKERLVVKVGEEMTPHFAHQAASLCIGSGGEGPIHERGKWLLYIWLKKQYDDVQLEVFIPQIQQQPDILLTIGKRKIALEFQYSPIATSIIRKRTRIYQENDYYPIWILDKRHLQQRSTHKFIMNSFVKQCLFQRSSHSSPLLFFFCTETEEITTLHHIRLISLTIAFAQKYTFSLQTTRLNQLFQRKSLQTNALLYIWRANKQSFRIQRRRATGKQRAWLDWLYERDLPIDYLPAVVHLPVKGQLFMNVQPWNWQSRLWYFLQNEVTDQQQFSVGDCIHVLQSFIYPANHFPLLTNEPSPIAAYIQWLVLFGHVRQITTNSFQLHTSIPPLSHIEEAMKQDEEIMKQIVHLTRSK